MVVPVVGSWKGKTRLGMVQEGSNSGSAVIFACRCYVLSQSCSTPNGRLTSNPASRATP